MLCNLCGKNEASIEFEGLINGKNVKFYLCDECMKSIDIESAMNRSHFSPDDLLSALSASMKEGGRNGDAAYVCPDCGSSFDDVAKAAENGCARCRKQFSQRLKSILRKANDSSKDASRQAVAAAVKENRLREAADLQRELNRAVAREEYERAAVLRDRIRELEGKAVDKTQTGGME